MVFFLLLGSMILVLICVIVHVIVIVSLLIVFSKLETLDSNVRGKTIFHN